MRFVIARASLVLDIRVGMALAFPQVVALNAPDGLFLEFIHVENEVGFR